MTYQPFSNRSVSGRAISRRDFLWLTSMSAAGLITGCATNPVTGESQLMLMSETQEIDIDKQHAPHQFSTDYGPVQDRNLNAYLQQVGTSMAAHTHRPHMPYSFRAVNATYVNAYAFPGGSIATTRGILLELDNEAELAALTGHELGHVNARHTAQQMSKGMITQVLAMGAAVYVGVNNPKYQELAMMLGMVGAGALLASYSRDNERQADALGMEYMVRDGYSPQGMVGLMDMLNSKSKHGSSITQLLFATHPMSQERYDSATRSAAADYPQEAQNAISRERYMDNIANLRAMEGAIKQLQKGETEMARKKYAQAQTHIKTALDQAPDDYAGLCMMGKCLLAQKKDTEAQRYLDQAKAVYPQEAQALHLSGFASLQNRNFDGAYNDFNRYEQLLPGNPSTVFLKGLSLEGMQNRKGAAREYYRYLQIVDQGDQAQYAYQRLVQWGAIKR